MSEIINNRETATISCELELAPKYERDKHTPFELNVVINSIT